MTVHGAKKMRTTCIVCQHVGPFSPTDYSCSVAASGDGSVKLWDVLSPGRPIKNYHEHEHEVYSVDWNLVNKVQGLGSTINRSQTVAKYTQGYHQNVALAAGCILTVFRVGRNCLSLGHGMTKSSYGVSWTRCRG